MLVKLGTFICRESLWSQNNNLSFWQLLSIHGKHSVPTAVMESSDVTSTKPGSPWPCQAVHHFPQWSREPVWNSKQKGNTSPKHALFCNFFFLPWKTVMDRRWAQAILQIQLLPHFPQILVILVYPERELRHLWHLRHLINKFNSLCCISRQIEMLVNVF